MLGLYLLGEALVARQAWGSSFGLYSSQIDQAVAFAVKYPAVVSDIALFSFSGAIGQVFIFYIITEYGSLTSVLITVTRKFFSILLSVVIFGHKVQSWQWVGCTMVFVGLLINTSGKLSAGEKNKNDAGGKNKKD
jgi:UDP-galactose transporter B1